MAQCKTKTLSTGSRSYVCSRTYTHKRTHTVFFLQNRVHQSETRMKSIMFQWLSLNLTSFFFLDIDKLIRTGGQEIESNGYTHYLPKNLGRFSSDTGGRMVIQWGNTSVIYRIQESHASEEKHYTALSWTLANPWKQLGELKMCLKTNHIVYFVNICPIYFLSIIDTNKGRQYRHWF